MSSIFSSVLTGSFSVGLYLLCLLVAGVCGGIGEYFNIDPTLVRLGFVALSFLAGGGLLVYILAAIIIPDKVDE